VVDRGAIGVVARRALLDELSAEVAAPAIAFEDLAIDVGRVFGRTRAAPPALVSTACTYAAGLRAPLGIRFPRYERVAALDASPLEFGALTKLLAVPAAPLAVVDATARRAIDLISPAWLEHLPARRVDASALWRDGGRKPAAVCLPILNAPVALL